MKPKDQQHRRRRRRKSALVSCRAAERGEEGAGVTAVGAVRLQGGMCVRVCVRRAYVQQGALLEVGGVQLNRKPRPRRNSEELIPPALSASLHGYHWMHQEASEGPQ